MNTRATANRARRSRNPIENRAGLNENLLASIHVLSRQISRVFFTRVEARFDVTLAEWRIILTLVDRPGATANEIIDLWAMEKMAVSRAVRRLERMGRISRRVNPTDRRSFALVLTKRGRRVYEQVLPSANERYREITAGLTKAELAGLRKMIRGLVSHIGRLPD